MWSIDNKRDENCHATANRFHGSTAQTTDVMKEADFKQSDFIGDNLDENCNATCNSCHGIKLSKYVMNDGTIRF